MRATQRVQMRARIEPTFAVQTHRTRQHELLDDSAPNLSNGCGDLGAVLGVGVIRGDLESR